MSTTSITIGIDIGGSSKGFHAVALADGRYHAHFAGKDIAEMAQCVSPPETGAVEHRNT